MTIDWKKVAGEMEAAQKRDKVLAHAANRARYANSVQARSRHASASFWTAVERNADAAMNGDMAAVARIHEAALSAEAVTASMMASRATATFRTRGSRRPGSLGTIR